ncbi:hypothetical protein DL93DRAFT_2084295 [Clavulina sp. PMI_390]|nr:hypothetical protein DL93DRAFT_2084295 [Clavulina sp. PMI_390]
MLRAWVGASITKWDKELSITREESASKIYRRRIPGKTGQGDGEDEDEDGSDGDGGDGATGGNGGDGDDDDDDADEDGDGAGGSGSGSGAPKEACWYGAECRTKDHNADHANRYDVSRIPLIFRTPG